MDSKWARFMNEARPPAIDRAAAAALIEPLTEIVIRAGAAILAVNRSAMRVDGKSDGSPVTEADLAADRVIAEMMGPITMDGQSILWEYFGRRFIPLSYSEADKHCQISREFISALLPKEDIYLSLLPPEARDVVGKVGAETIPARKMLEKLGFAYTDTIDPFDGGPHLEAVTDDIPIVRGTRPATLGPAAASPAACTRHGFVSTLNTEGEFKAVETDFAIDAKHRVSLPRPLMAEIGWESGASIGVTIFPPERKKPAPKPSRGKTKAKA